MTATKPSTPARAKAAAKALRILTGAPLRTCQQVATFDLDADRLGRSADDVTVVASGYLSKGRARPSAVALLLDAILPDPIGVDTIEAGPADGHAPIGVAVRYPWAESDMGARTLEVSYDDWSTGTLTATTRRTIREGGTPDTTTVATGKTADCDDPLWVAKGIANAVLSTGTRDIRNTVGMRHLVNSPTGTPDTAAVALAGVFDTWFREAVDDVIRWVAAGGPLDGWDDTESDNTDPVFPWLLDTLVTADPTGDDGLMADYPAHEVAAVYDRTRGDRQAARDVIMAAVALTATPQRTMPAFMVNVADTDRPDVFLSPTATADTHDDALAIAKGLLAADHVKMVTIDTVDHTAYTANGRFEGTQTHVATLLDTPAGVVRFDHTDR